MPHTRQDNNQFFLTQQTANLREDFCREVKSAASLFLVYGDSLVGKSCFLRELVSTRFDSSRVHWLDFNAGQSVSINSNEPNRPTVFSVEIDRILNTAKTQDIIVADHF
jgi:GTPase SAR1 family protein